MKYLSNILLCKTLYDSISKFVENLCIHYNHKDYMEISMESMMTN